ncbi:hypothetical protein K492DRAFT_233298, partial [Lichtheimia hyalospora FSU 10163]
MRIVKPAYLVSYNPNGDNWKRQEKLTTHNHANYLPGMDLPSKHMLKTQTTIDIVARSLLDVSIGTYCSP